MRFVIDNDKINDLSLLRLQDNATGAMVAILPDYGALLHAFEIPLKGKSLNVVDNYSGRSDIEQELTTSYKSAKLSPFVCRTAGGKYNFRGQDYVFSRKFMDGTAIHGLLADKPFDLLDQAANDQFASATLHYHYGAEDPGYPFHYSCEVRYTLYPGWQLQLQTIVRSREEGHLPIPMADGWHPYFTLGGSVNDYELQFNGPAMLEFDNYLIPTGKLLPNTAFREPALLGSRELDNCFRLDIQPDTPSCILRNPRNGLTLSLYPGENYPYLQLYTPGHRKSIAIENLSSAPDCFNNGMGLALLESGQTATFNVRYQLSVE